MRRRGVTVILGALITALLAVGVMAFPLPYVVLKPGPTVNTLGSDNGKEVITVKGTGADTSASVGQLRLTTVGVQPSVELVWAIRGWFSDEQAVVPRELIYPPNQSEQQIEQQNNEAFEDSQHSAVTVALLKLGYPLQTVVTKVTEGGPSVNRLQKDDLITTVDGTKVDAPGRLTELIRAKPAGTTLAIGYTRGGKPGTATITTVGGQDQPPRIGVEVAKKQGTPFTVEIDLDKIGGPSAGLMFTLGIIDKLTPADLTGGKIIAGTGTINDDVGNVGPIGGIPQKLVGAKRAGAQLFLVPAANCAEAVRNAVPGLPTAKVSTVDEALTALKTFTSGGTPTPCPAG